MDWYKDAACVGMNFFILPGRTTEKKRVCNKCRVNNECLTEAMRLNDYSSEIWGGFSGKERKRLSEGTVW